MLIQTSLNIDFQPIKVPNLIQTLRQPDITGLYNTYPFGNQRVKGPFQNDGPHIRIIVDGLIFLTLIPTVDKIIFTVGYDPDDSSKLYLISPFLKDNLNQLKPLRNSPSLDRWLRAIPTIFAYVVASMYPDIVYDQNGTMAIWHLGFHDAPPSYKNLQEILNCPETIATQMSLYKDFMLETLNSMKKIIDDLTKAGLNNLTLEWNKIVDIVQRMS